MKRDTLFGLIEAAADIGVGSEEDGDEESAEYSRGVVELLAGYYWPSYEFQEAKQALMKLFYALNGEA